MSSNDYPSTPLQVDPVFVFLKSALSFSPAAGWQAYGSDRDTRGVRLPAVGVLQPDALTLILTATTLLDGQVARSAGYGWATWPVASVFDKASGAPLIPWLAVHAGATGDAKAAVQVLPAVV